MRKLFPLMIGLLLFAACKKSNDMITPPTPTQPITDPVELYDFRNIQYSMGDGDGEELFSISGRSRGYLNGTQLTQSYTVDPADGNMETSTFQSDDKNAFKILNDKQLKVKVPIFFNQNKQASLGEQEWLYSSDQKQFPSKLDLKESFLIPPYQQLNLDIKLNYRKYKASYSATFVSQKSGKEVTIKGKWTGNILLNSEITSALKDIPVKQ